MLNGATYSDMAMNQAQFEDYKNETVLKQAYFTMINNGMKKPVRSLLMTEGALYTLPRLSKIGSSYSLAKNLTYKKISTNQLLKESRLNSPTASKIVNIKYANRIRNLVPIYGLASGAIYGASDYIRKKLEKNEEGSITEMLGSAAKTAAIQGGIAYFANEALNMIPRKLFDPITAAMNNQIYKGASVLDITNLMSLKKVMMETAGTKGAFQNYQSAKTISIGPAINKFKGTPLEVFRSKSYRDRRTIGRIFGNLTDLKTGMMEDALSISEKEMTFIENLFSAGEQVFGKNQKMSTIASRRFRKLLKNIDPNSPIGNIIDLRDIFSTKNKNIYLSKLEDIKKIQEAALRITSSKTGKVFMEQINKANTLEEVEKIFALHGKDISQNIQSMKDVKEIYKSFQNLYKPLKTAKTLDILSTAGMAATGIVSAVSTAFNAAQTLQMSRTLIDYAMNSQENYGMGFGIGRYADSYKTATERQRAIQAISNAHLSARRFIGSEAQMMHSYYGQ